MKYLALFNTYEEAFTKYYDSLNRLKAELKEEFIQFWVEDHEGKNNNHFVLIPKTEIKGIRIEPFEEAEEQPNE